MSDEIEIEEHDVLDNPNIKRIFPDLSVIKKEISQYEEGLGSTLENTIQDVDATTSLVSEEPDQDHHQLVSKTSAKSIPSELAQQTSANHRLEVHLRFKTFLDSLTDDILENIDSNYDCNLKTNDDNLKDTSVRLLASNKTGKIKNKKREEEEIESSRGNVFILGSKPSGTSLTKKTPIKRQLKIVLKNIKAYLNECRRFCEYCRILFPSDNAMMCHMRKIHSPGNSNSMAEKQEQKSRSYTELQCDICSHIFASKGNLGRHMKNVHKYKKPKKSSNKIHKRKKILKLKSKPKEIETASKDNAIIKEPAESKDSKSSNPHACFHCSEIFETRSSLIEHLYNIIKPTKTNATTAQINKQTSVESRGNINDKVEMSDNNKQSETFECSECALKFTTVNALDQHFNEKHLNDPLTSNEENSDSTENNLQEAAASQLSESELSQNDIEIYSEENKSIKNADCGTNPNSPGSPDYMSVCATDSEQNVSMVNPKGLVKKGRHLFQCFVCALYMTHYKWYSFHMHVHNVKKSSEWQRTTFEPQCRFCSLTFATVKTYNYHVSKVHREKLTAKIKIDEKAFKSIIFKCHECDVFFLSGNVAKDHSEHSAICVEWKCTECERLFKMNDKVIHMQQHTLSKKITAYACGPDDERVLFKCLKCTVHFSEEEYFRHYTTCDCEIPDSTFCISCDALINKTDMPLHEQHHKEKGLDLTDFTFIETDVIISKEEQSMNGKNNVIPKFELTYCSTCKCFISDMGKTRKAHIEKRCGVINPRTCTKCGLIFTARGYISHKMFHDKINDLTMQYYYFYDIKSKQQIRPPIPKYPQCNICEVHFLNKQVIKEHACSEQHYKICKICKIKLTEAAYKLHMNFHDYKLTSCALYNIYKKDSEKLKTDEPTTNRPTENVIPESSIISNVSCLYTCVICNFTVDIYDKAIEHCHDHYDFFKGNKANYTKQMQLNDKHNDKSAMIVKFDPFYIRFPNDVWIKHIFVNVSKEIVQNILDHSIYKFESRFKMEEIQSGPFSLVLYKCDICRSYIEPNTLYTHARNSCSAARQHPCSICGLCFYTLDCQMVHEKIHTEYPDIKTSSYKIILYNKTEHLQFTRMMISSRDKFVLYQCRNCELIVDKLQRKNHKCQNIEIMKCSHCGLLFREEDFNLHINKHKEFLYYKPENMTLIMFGKLGVQIYNELKPTFEGTIYDLTFYKCINCGLCLKSKNDISKHICIAKSYKAQCPKCYLSFVKKELHEHLQLHENNLELGYDDFNSNIITFDLSTSVVNNDKEDASNCSKRSKHNNKEDTKYGNENIIADVTQKIYKCNCGLHFLEELNAKRHCYNCNPKLKISKQSCIKCDLTFTPGELFNHLLKHHGDKKIQYKYNIITITDD